ncbi:hypothetical protein [Xenorhabdus ishibashii]|uniref:Uncharacterized protein n=1 Tax=Xenorhabdus ishibashii TaxID=1034471 RepID=A0A2D0K7S3_9GAMM|nr:hypothetical protein [Xenorhabdus ishibashii]PHM59494.1 hypothetical protein Xish_03612 [Xenorhabdus ishibashii]
MKLKKLFAVKKPCVNCPFLKETRFILSEGRLDSIKKKLLEDDEHVFECHETTFSTGGYFDENSVYHASGKESYCAGAMGWLMLKKRPNIAMRLGHAFGEIDLKELEEATRDLLSE